MFRNKSYFIAVILSVVFLLAACGPKINNSEDPVREVNPETIEVAKEDFPIVREEIELTLMAPNVGLADWGSMPTLEHYAEKTNIQIDYITPSIDEFQTRFNLTVTSGDLPDILFAPGSNVLTPALEVKYGEEGVLMPLNDLIEEYAPNLNKLLNDYPEIKDAITTPDGNIYALPGLDGSDSALWPSGPLWYRGDWLEVLEADVPETLDEFYDLLLRFRDDDPNGNAQMDEIPFSSAGLNQVRPWLLGAFSLNSWGLGLDGDQVYYTPKTNNAREYYKFMNQLYEERLIDQDLFIQSDLLKKEKGNDNLLGVFQDWYSFFTTGQSQSEAINNPMFKPLTSEWSSERTIGVSSQIKRGTFALSSTNKFPEASMRWIDYFYTTEGFEFMNRGPEGYYWEWADDAKDKKILSERAKEEGEDYRGIISPLYGLETPGIIFSLPALDEDADTNFEDFIAKETTEKVEEYGVLAFPLIYLTDQEIKEATRTEADLSAYVIEQEEKFVTGELDPADDEDWGDYLKTIDQMGLDSYLEIYQSAYDRQK